MIPNEFETALYASMAGFVVGAVMKLVTKFLERDKNELDMHVTLRKELREELDTVKTDLHRLQSELDEWKQKYYDQVQLTNQLKLDIISLTDELGEYKRTSGIFPMLDSNGEL
jgi:chromosome segregation ATPase